MRKIAFYTLGCKVNQYETEAMRELFEKNGDVIVESDQEADVYVINTCTVTNVGDKKSRQFIRKSKRMNPNALIAVVGCYSQIAPDEIKNIEGVNLVLGTNDRNQIVELLNGVSVNEQKAHVANIMDIREFEEMTVDKIEGKTRAFLKIQEGCNQYCSYCIIPYARGPIRSRDPQNVIDEVKRLVKNGFSEIVLTGIHVASYGKDLDNVSLLELIKRVHDVEGLKRIRLSSAEPNMLRDDFIRILSKLPKVCPHFHISLQSGSDATLKRMNRKYTTSEYKEIVRNLRTYLPKASITTDIIVGFPGETNEEFEETCAFVKDIGFSQVHVFKYSPREGTPAAKMKEQVDGLVKNSRSNTLMDIAGEMQLKYIKSQMGQRMCFIVERIDSKKQTVEGLTPNYLRVQAKNRGFEEGQEAEVVLLNNEGEMVWGDIVSSVCTIDPISSSE